MWSWEERLDATKEMWNFIPSDSAKPAPGFCLGELFLGGGRETDSRVKSAGREPGYRAGNTGHWRNDEKLYKIKMICKREFKVVKQPEIKWTEFRLVDWFCGAKVGGDTTEGSHEENLRLEDPGE